MLSHGCIAMPWADDMAWLLCSWGRPSAFHGWEEPSLPHRSSINMQNFQKHVRESCLADIITSSGASPVLRASPLLSTSMPLFLFSHKAPKHSATREKLKVTENNGKLYYCFRMGPLSSLPLTAVADHSGAFLASCCHCCLLLSKPAEWWCNTVVQQWCREALLPTAIQTACQGSLPWGEPR